MKELTNELKGRSRSRFIHILQFVISLGLMVLIFWRVEWYEFVKSFENVSIFYIFIFYILLFINFTVSCFRWRYILLIEKILVPLMLLMRWQLIGLFLSNFIPTAGGDIGRGYFAGRYTGKYQSVGRSIIIDRVLGVFWLLIFAWWGLIFFGYHNLALIILISFILLSFSIFLFYRLFVKEHVPTNRFWNFRGKITGFVKLYTSSRDALLLPFLISAIVQLSTMIGAWLTLTAVGAHLPLFPAMLIFALANSASLIPVSVNGWGLREAIFLFFSQSFLVDPSRILAGLILSRAMLFLVSMVGLWPLLIEMKKVDE